VLAALAVALALAVTPGSEASVVAGITRALAVAPAGGARAVAATRPLVGAPYVPSPLGESTGRDSDPRFRLDAFDCMTLVETAVALGSASTLAEARVALDDVRYSGPPTYAARNHEVLSQWIPANVAKGFIAEPGGMGLLPAGAGRVAKEYTAASWEAVRAAGRAIPGLPRARLPLGRFEIALVPPAEARLVAARLGEGTIVFVVRADAPERATRITHAGLVVHGPAGEPLVRHATSTKGVARVIEEPIERFVRREGRAYPRWPLEGLAFFEIRDASARVRTLATGPHPADGSGGPLASPPAGL
jgi:hypothetical protein